MVLETRRTETGASREKVKYRLLEHTADIRVRIQARSLKELFQNALYALSDQLVVAPSIRKKISRKVAVRAENKELLLVRFLQEMLFLFDAKRFVSRRFEFEQFEGKKIKGRVWGERLSSERHHPKTEIKAVTYHGLKIGKNKRRWFVEMVFDV